MNRNFALMTSSAALLFFKLFTLNINYNLKEETQRKVGQRKRSSEQSYDSWPIKHTIEFAVSRWPRTFETPGSIFPKSWPGFISGQNENIFWLTLITFWPKSRKILTTLLVLESYEPGTIQTWSIGLETKSISFLGLTGHTSWKSGQLN